MSAGTTRIGSLSANSDIILGSDGSGVFSSVTSSGVRSIIVQAGASVDRIESEGGRVVSDGSVGTIVQFSGTLTVEGKGSVGTVHTRGEATVSSETADTIVCSTDSVDVVTVTGSGAIDIRIDGAEGASIVTQDGADVRLSTELEDGPVATVDGEPVEVHRPVAVSIEGEGVSVTDGDREVPSGSKVAYGTVLTVTMAERTGYTGTVSASVGSVSGDSYTAVEDVTFTGTYTVDEYTLTVRYTGAPSAIPDHVERAAYGSAYSVESPAVTGYAADTAVVSGTMPAEDLTVEVSYSVQTYKLTVRYTGTPSPVADHVEDVAFGSRYSVSSPSVNGYSPDRRVVSGTMPAEDTVITVAYTKNSTYVPPVVRQDPVVTIAGEGVTVRAGDKEITSGSTVASGTVLTVTIANRTGYTGTVTASVGTISEGSYTVSKNVTFTGTYTVNEYALTVKYTGTTSTINDHTERVAYGATYSVQSPAVPGFTPDITTVSGTMPAEDTVITVTYAPDLPRVTIVGEGVSVKNGDQSIESGSTVAVGTVLTVTIAERTGYTGTVSASVGTISKGSYTVSKDVTFTGTYTVNEYVLTVRYTGAPSAIPDNVGKAAYGSTYSVESPVVTGYTPNVAVMTGIMPEHDVTVEVVYTAASYTITWKDSDGTVLDTTSVEYGSIPSHADPVRTGEDGVYVFKGWTPSVKAATKDAEYKAEYDVYKHLTISKQDTVEESEYWDIEGGEYWDVKVSESVGEGEVTLKGVSIHGKLIVEGGGSNSIVLDGCTIGKVESKKSGVRIVAKGTTVPMIEASQPIIIEGKDSGFFGNVKAVNGIEVQSGAKVGTLDVTGNAKIDGHVEKHVQRNGTVSGEGGSAQIVAYGTVEVPATITDSILCPEDSTNANITVTGNSESVSISIEVNGSDAVITGVELNDIYTSSGAMNVDVNGTQQSVGTKYVVEVSGGTVSERNGTSTSNRIEVAPNTVVTVKYDIVDGKTFSMWTDHMGDRIPGSGDDHSFDLLVTCDTYISAHYTDEESVESGTVVTVKEKRYCHETSICYVSMPDGHRYYYATPATEHVFGETTVTTAPTCLIGGSGTHTCIVCGYSEDVSIPATGHDYGDWTMTVDKNGDASKVRTCSECHAEDRISITVPNGNIEITLDMPGLAKEVHYIFEHEGKTAYLYSILRHNDTANDAWSYFLWIDDGAHSPVFVLRTFNSYYVYGNDSPWGICGYADSYEDYVRFIADTRIGADNGRTNTGLYDLFFMYADTLNEKGTEWFTGGTGTASVAGIACTPYEHIYGNGALDYYWVDEGGSTLMYKHHNGSTYTITYEVKKISDSGSYSDFRTSGNIGLPGIPSLEGVSQYRVDVTGGAYNFESTERQGYYNVTTVDSFGGIRPNFPDGAASFVLQVKGLDGNWVPVQSWDRDSDSSRWYIPTDSTGGNHTIRTLFAYLAASHSDRFVGIGDSRFSDIEFRCVFGDTSKGCSITVTDGYYIDPVTGEEKTSDTVPAGLVVEIHANEKPGMTHTGWTVVKNSGEPLTRSPGTLEFLAEEGTASITPQFSEIRYRIHLRATDGGTLTGCYVSDNTGTEFDGGFNSVLVKETQLVVTAVPDPGYRFVGWYWINSASVNGLSYPSAEGYGKYGYGPDTDNHLSIVVDGNRTYTAVFESMAVSGNMVFVTDGFVYDSGRGIMASSIYADGTVSLTTDPNVTSRTYYSWSISKMSNDADPEIVSIVSGTDSTYEPEYDVTVKAVFEDEITRYVLSFDGNGEGDTVTNVPSPISRPSEGTVTIPETKPMREGYKFWGWSTNTSEMYETYCIQPGTPFTLTSENTALYAIWKEYTPLTIRFKVDAFGTYSQYQFDPVKVAYNQSYYIDDAHFAGPGFDVIRWTDEEGNAYTKDGNRTVHWKEDGPMILTAKPNDPEDIEFWTIVVEFHSNIPDTEDEVEERSFVYGGEQSREISSFAPDLSKPEGYTFKGWSKTTDGEIVKNLNMGNWIDPKEAVSYEPLAKGEHIHLYAIWTPDES